MTVSLVISPAAVRLLVSEGLKARKWASIALTPGAVSNGQITDREVVVKALQEAYKSTGARKEPVLAAISGLPFTHRTISLPVLKSAQVPEALERAAHKEIPLPADETYYVWHPLAKGNKEQKWFLAGVSRKPVDALVECLAAAGVRPLAIDLEPLALARAAGPVNALVLSLSPEQRQIVLVADGVPEIMHSVAPLAREATLEENIQKLSGDLSRTVRFYDNTHPDKPFDATRPLLVTGDLVADDTIWTAIRGLMGFPAEILKLPMTGPADFPVMVYAANTGLALRRVAARSTRREGALTFHDISIDLNIGRIRAAGKKPAPKGSANRLPLVILLTVAAIGAAIFFGQLKNTAQAQNTGLQVRLQAIMEAQKAAQQETPDTSVVEAAIKQAQQRAAAVNQENSALQARAKFVYRNLDYITRFMPPGVRLDYLNVTERSASVKGEAESALAVVTYAQQLQQNPDFRQVYIREIAPRLATAEDESLSTDNLTTWQMSNLPVTFQIEMGR
jgi:Tfp pilus assembly protein PilN